MILCCFYCFFVVVVVVVVDESINCIIVFHIFLIIHTDDFSSVAYLKFYAQKEMITLYDYINILYRQSRN